MSSETPTPAPDPNADSPPVEAAAGGRAPIADDATNVDTPEADAMAEPDLPAASAVTPGEAERPVDAEGPGAEQPGAGGQDAQAAETLPAHPVAADGSATASAAGPAAAPVHVDLQACTEALRQRFPALFAGPPKPIKLRIQTDIQQRAPGVFSRQALSAFLRRHTGSTSYLIALGKATHRLDLDGQPAGEISAEHHEAAVQELLRRRELRRERELAMRQAQRPARQGSERVPTSAEAAPPQADAQQADAPRVDANRANDPPASGDRATRPTRPARPQRPARAPHEARPASPQRQRPPNEPRPPRPPRPPSMARPDLAAVETATAPAVVREQTPRAAPPAEDAARRERLQLMRAFDSSPLTKANFCALKRLTVEHLDAQLLLARQEAAAWAAAHPQPDRTPERGPDRTPDRGFDRRPDNRPDNRPHGPRDGRRDGGAGGGRPGGAGGPGGPRRDPGPAKGGMR